MPAGFPLPVLHCPLQVPGIHVGGQHLAAVRRGKQGVTAQGVQLGLIKGSGSHARQNVLCSLLAGLRGLIGRERQPAVDDAHQRRKPQQQRQHTAKDGLHQISQQYASQGDQPSFFH